MTKEELIDSIRNNRSFDLRSSEYYEPWDVLQETIKEMADDFYYLLKNVLDYLEDPKPKFDIGDTIRPKGSKAEYTITSISGGCYHGKGWGLPISAEKDYELVESAEDVDACNIQYASIDDAIKAHAEDYSFNIESELFQQLTPEQQKMWRKEIEQAVLSGAYSGLNLARDERYEENRQEESVSEELKDEIDAWCRTVITGLPIVKEAARHFADWQKQQMMKTAVHGDVDYPLIGHDFPNIYPNYRELKDYCDRHKIKDGDKVKLIIFKED